ncbi:hypothetical protein DXT99_22735 [Pontibacter diazotrophicus]|uniref:Glycosyltransferase RgtA/B/C/D-like domain-containing protein n=1 Tax=Pontibacter diazotrophicus TaxID=1400979 RepID=A0A3D8L5M3_9BACT|nr:hypothetical protein DXT99_22735 [Pontibacter diazotrophicus]
MLLLYIAVCAVILFRVNVEATGYLTPDSESYLELAQNLKNGKGFYLYEASTAEETFFSVWPVGYPVLIYFVSAVTSLDVFWASKVLNLLLVGLGFLLLRQINRKYSYILASVYCSYTLLEVYSFTWSEAPFLLGLLYLCYLVNKVILGDDTTKNILLLFLTCVFLFLMRYIGAFSFSVPALLACFCYYKQRRRTAIKLLVVFFLLMAVTGLYLFMNYSLSGYATGFDRLEAETESVRAFAGMMAEGLLNELLIIRKFRMGNQPDYLLYLTILLQLAVTAIIIAKLKRHYLLEQLKNDSFSLACFIVALLYLAAIVFLRSFSHFDDLDYRLLAPFSFLFWIGMLHLLVSLPDNIRSTVQAKNIAFVFFMISLLLNLPKQYILEKVVQLLS